MNKKQIMVTGCCLVLLVLGGILAEIYYFKPKQLYAVNTRILKELSVEYGIPFKVSEIKFAKALGDEEGIYTASVYPKDQSDLEFQVHVSEGGNIIDESFKETKWRSEAIKSWEPFMSRFGEISYAVNIHIPEEIANQYSVDDTYGDIFKVHKHKMHEYLFIGEIESSFDKEKETAKIMEVANQALNRDLNDFSIEWLYFDSGKKSEDVFEMKEDIPSYSWRFSKNSLQEGVTEEKLNQFFMKHE
ncbi:hypothetical protein AM500_13825 [Bacillus sp. FJAT-18017]|uniref:hypothetical protein n=1 Tax=Bacillus sp. FJAT-18017 TaxID=1705566 RepID=UPI0006AE1E05|nr:hypothetical protein [Bacillus sp. FJAT-18017]ALC90745.1 hypothetical protein AM500_13825 [Bacillus sp. FJAT-18017]